MRRWSAASNVRDRSGARASATRSEFANRNVDIRGTLPGPVIEACEGDTVTIRMSNNDTDPAMGTDHGFDSHAFQMDTMRFAAVAPGETLELTGEVSVPGVFMYHCASASATDW